MNGINQRFGQNLMNAAIFLAVMFGGEGDLYRIVLLTIFVIGSILHQAE